MTITINLQDDSATIGGKTKPLDHLRRYLLINQAELCKNSFIKAILIDGKTVFTYDWDYIFFTAQSPLISINYYKSL